MIFFSLKVKVRGHRVDLSEIERATFSLAGVDKSTVLCYHPGQEDQAILAFVTLQAGHLMTEMQVENALADRLASYMIPQVYLSQIQLIYLKFFPNFVIFRIFLEYE